LGAPVRRTSPGRPSSTIIETRDAFLARLAAVVGWASSGRLRLKMDHVYPFERAAEAQIALAGRQTTGTVLLVP
jgi:NADPH:quinone reductase-like Zn-dependent oxidoreductase